MHINDRFVIRWTEMGNNNNKNWTRNRLKRKTIRNTSKTNGLLCGRPEQN